MSERGPDEWFERAYAKQVAAEDERLREPVPECDCIKTHRGPHLHRDGCPRMAAIVALYRPNDPPRSQHAKP